MESSPTSGPVERVTSATLPVHDHAARRERLRTAVGDGDGSGSADDAAADAGGASPSEWLLVTDPHNVRYLTGFRGSNGQLLLGPDAGSDRLVTDDRYVARAAEEAPDLEVERSRDPLAVALRYATGSVLGLEAGHVSWDLARQAVQRGEDAGVRVAATTGSVERLREIKDDAEVARLALACELTADALRWLFEHVVAPGRTERELAIALERRFLDLGADGVAFPSIVASGPKGAVPHHEPSSRELERGDLVTIDCGALVDGYHADITRTVSIGTGDGRLRAVHEVVRQAQAAGRQAATAGTPARDVDAAARAVVADAGYGDRFVHGTGHGVGLQIHEAPAVAATSTATLAAGTALTVEPGIYLPGVGGVRIEDTIVVTVDGAPRILADLPHELSNI